MSAHHRRRHQAEAHRGVRFAEALAVACAPAAALFLLHLRPMAPIDMPDPAIHTAFIVHPHDMFERYGALLAKRANDREAARVGFLIPARIAFLAFGLIPGFFVTRYVFALVAIVPAYVLLRRLAGPAAGAVAVLVLLTCPVVLTAWGTDYPDSAAVSYLTGGLAALAMPARPAGRRRWLTLAGVLFALATWSHLAAIPLEAAALACYLGVRLARERRRLVGDVVAIVVAAALTTGLLVPLSVALIGPANFISPLLDTVSVLGSSSATTRFHSTNWRWAPYRAYLLVPPAIVFAWFVSAARRVRGISTADLVVGVSAAVELAVFAFLQFGGHVETLEDHYFSSQLWGAVCLAMALALVRLGEPLLRRRATAWVPAGLLVAAVLVYEHVPRVPAIGWLPVGVLLAVGVGLAAVAARLAGSFRGLAAPALAAVALTVVVGAVLVLSTAPSPRHRPLTGIAPIDYPLPAYAGALGGSGSWSLDEYRVSDALTRFVGPASYPGEELLAWYARPDQEFLNGPLGMYRSHTNSLYPTLPNLNFFDNRFLLRRRAPELLLAGSSSRNFPAAFRALHAYDPRVLRTAVLSSGRYHLSVWLLGLGRFGRGRLVPR